MVLEKNIESPLDCKEIKPSILKEINPEYSSEGLVLKLQYSGHLTQRADSTNFQDPDAGKDGEGGATGDEMAGWRH